MIHQFTDSSGTKFKFKILGNNPINKNYAGYDCIDVRFEKYISEGTIDIISSGNMFCYHSNGSVVCPSNFDNVFSEEAQKYLIRILNLKTFI